MNIVFVGDFYQLPPVGAKLSSSFLSERASHMVVQGLHLWQTVAVTSVVELTVNYRQRTDPTFFDLLERFRLGRPTVEDIELLNTRVVYPGQPLPPNIRKAAATNKVQEASSHYSFLQYLRRNPAFSTTSWLERGAIVVEAVVKGSATSRALDASKIPYILSLSEARWKGKFSGLLKLVVGHDYVHTKNTDVYRGLANGTMCTLQRVVLRPGANVWFEPNQDCGGGLHIVSAKDVLCVVLKHKAQSHATAQVYPTLSPGEFPLAPELCTIKRVTFSTCGTFTVDIFQIQLISGSTTTGHKLQGDTLEHLMLIVTTVTQGTVEIRTAGCMSCYHGQLALTEYI